MAFKDAQRFIRSGHAINFLNHVQNGTNFTLCDKVTQKCPYKKNCEPEVLFILPFFLGKIGERHRFAYQAMQRMEDMN